MDIGQSEQLESKRPKLVTFLSILLGFMAISVLWSQPMLMSSEVPNSVAELRSSFTIVDWIAPWIGLVILLAASISLFLLKKVSVVLLAIYTVFITLATIWHALMTKWLDVYGMKGVAAAGVGLLISVLITYYAWSLQKKGVIK